MRLYRFTYVLIALAFAGLLGSFVTRSANLQSSSGRKQEVNQREKNIQRQADLRRSYPTVDYEEKESSDPQVRATQKQNKIRHNNRPVVSKVPSPKDVEIASYSHAQFDFPALPFGKADAVVIVDIVQAKAHLSEDKGSVYSEFVGQISKIYVAGAANLTDGKQITIERQGGYVKYPNGQTVLYRVQNYGMPSVGSRYVLFLNSIKDSDVYRILNGYELGDTVTPLDLSPQFEVYRGMSELEFLKTLEESVPQLKKGS